MSTTPPKPDSFTDSHSKVCEHTFRRNRSRIFTIISAPRNSYLQQAEKAFLERFSRLPKLLTSLNLGKSSLTQVEANNSSGGTVLALVADEYLVCQPVEAILCGTNTVFSKSSGKNDEF